MSFNGSSNSGNEKSTGNITILDTIINIQSTISAFREASSHVVHSSYVPALIGMIDQLNDEVKGVHRSCTKLSTMLRLNCALQPSLRLEHEIIQEEIKHNLLMSALGDINESYTSCCIESCDVDESVIEVGNSILKSAPLDADIWTWINLYPKV
jgi:hypothetical protein